MPILDGAAVTFVEVTNEVAVVDGCVVDVCCSSEAVVLAGCAAVVLLENSEDDAEKDGAALLVKLKAGAGAAVVVVAAAKGAAAAGAAIPGIVNPSGFCWPATAACVVAVVVKFRPVDLLSPVPPKLNPPVVAGVDPGIVNKDV